MPAVELTPLVAALGYARRGWSVVPVHTPAGAGCSCRRADCPAVGKHPRVRWEARTRARASPAEIEAWWRRWPDANVGVVTGAVSGIAVLDVDPRHEGDAALTGLEARWGALPHTPEVRTGGGGRHLWFACGPESMPSALLAAGLELKGEGSVAVAPPSLHASGRRYEWLAGKSPYELELARVPVWIEALAHGGPAWMPGHSRADAPARTSQEQAEFAQAWERAGITLQPGDHYYLCPFHPDHRPSLHVDGEGCRWFCFGCRRGGGIGALQRLLGEPRPPAARGRLRMQVGAARLVTLEGEDRVEVVGESAHQDELLALAGGRRPYGGVELGAVAELVPDPDQPDDPEAVAVIIDGRPVGRLRWEDARRLRLAIDESVEQHGFATCRSLVRGGWDRGGDDVGLFGVVLFLPAVERGGR